MVQHSVTENNRYGSRVLVRVKMRGKSSRGGAAMCHQDKPCGLKCHVHPYSRMGQNLLGFVVERHIRRGRQLR